MEEPPREGEAEVAERSFSTWERQCLAEVEQGEPLAPELQAEAATDAAGLKSERQRLWHLFQKAATSVAQLYQDSGGQQPELSVWDPFQSAAVAVTGLYKESGDAHRRSFDLGVQVGCQRRLRDVLEWAKKGRSTIRREDLISFLCGKAPPAAPQPRAPRTPPKPTAGTPSRSPAGTPPKPPAGTPSQASAAESSAAVDVDLQLFREAAAPPHGLDGAVANIGVRPGPPSSPAQDGGIACAGRRKSSFLEDDLNLFGTEELGLRLDTGGVRKRSSAQFDDGITNSPSPKRNRMV